MKTVILTSCNNSFEAKIIQGNLANEGIESMISNENYTSLYPNMNVLGNKALVASNMSSTKIRERIKFGLSIDAFVPDGVATYIQKKGFVNL